MENPLPNLKAETIDERIEDELSGPETDVLTPERLMRNRKIYDLSVKLNDIEPLGPGQQQLTPVKMTRKAYDEDEVKFFIAYGPHGHGKSTYLSKCLAQLNGTWDPKVLKRFIIWKPTMFRDVIKDVEQSGHDEFMCGCDDAGVWLNALRWNDPLLVAITEYLDVIREHFHAVMFTSPLPLHVLKRIRGLPQSINIRIDKINSDVSKPRRATGYTQYMLPDLKKTRVKTEFIDNFFAIMPEKFYKWYHPVRKGFTKKAYEHVSDQLEKYKDHEIEIPA